MTMNNDQLVAARRAMRAFTALKVTIDGGCILTPYLKDDVFTRGSPFTVTTNMTDSEVEAGLRASCQALMDDQAP